MKILKKLFNELFNDFMPFENLDIENLISQKLLELGASNLDRC